MARRPASLQVRFDCHEDWSAFMGEGGVRLCQGCARQVHDLSALTRCEARALMTRPGGPPCVRYTHDGEGRVLFRDERRPGRRIWQRFVLDEPQAGGIVAGGDAS